MWRQVFSTLLRGSFRVLPFLPKVPGSLLSVLFPGFCLHCGRELEHSDWTGACPTCWAKLRPWPGLSCSACGLPAAPQSVQRPSGLCDLCHQGAYAFDLARSLTVYSGPARTLILQLKFRHRERLARKLGEALADSFMNGPFRQLVDFALLSGNAKDSYQAREEPVLLVPVPLHAARQRERGFNQAERIAQGLAAAARRANCPVRLEVDSRGLRRVKATLPQSGLDFQARQENVQGSFQADNKDSFRGKTVMLVDDVMTTGATASACSRELRRAGARKVVVLTVARAAPWLHEVANASRPAVDDEGA